MGKDGAGWLKNRSDAKRVRRYVLLVGKYCMQRNMSGIRHVLIT